jgi:hypothetical protein
MNEHTPSSPDDAAASTPPATSVWARMFNVFAAPGDVFSEVKASPAHSANWLLPAFLLVLVGWVGAWMVARDPVLQQQQREIQDQALVKMAAKLKWSEQELNAQRLSADERKGVSAGIGVFGVPVASALIAILWWAFILWLIGAKALGGDFAYAKALEAAGLIGMIELLNKVLTPLLQLAMGTLFASPTLALAVAKGFQPENALHLVLGSVNLLDLWGIAVSAIAVARLSGANPSKSLIWILGVWIPWKAVLIGLSLVMVRLFAS